MKKITFNQNLKIRWLLNKAIILFIFVLSNNYVTAQTYCTPTYYDDCSWGDDLNSFIFTGNGTSVLSDLNTGCTIGGYANKTTMTPVDILPGQPRSEEHTSELQSRENLVCR